MNTSTHKHILTIEEVAARFHELAQQEKWFDIQDELFAENVRSVEPANSPYMKNAEGKSAVRKKAEAFVSKVREGHHFHTTPPVIGGNYFSVGRSQHMTVEGLGKVEIDQIMLYEVKNGEIVLEQFFY